MAKRTSGKNISNDTSGGGTNWKEILVDLKRDPSGRKLRRLRLIGRPIEYWEATAYKRSEEDPKKRLQVPFPDAQFNKGFTRVCDDDPEKDIWGKMGYIRRKCYAINCIDREDGKVRVLAKGKSIFREFYKIERQNIDANIELAELGEPLLCTDIGGEEAPDVKITVITDPDALGGVSYEVSAAPRVNKITSEEIEKLRAVGSPTPEQIKQIREEDSELEEAPDWFFYGHDLEKLYKPSELRNGGVAASYTTPVEEMTIAAATDEDEDDEDLVDPFAVPVEIEEKEEDEVVEQPKEKKTTAKKAKEEVAAPLEEVEW